MAASTNKPSDSDKAKQSNDSSTKVHFSEKGAYKYVKGKREPISIRINRGLYSRFKPVAQRVFGSVCRAVEIYMVTIIETAETGVHFSNTEQPINIEKIVIERNLRPRRKLVSEGEVEQEVVKTGQELGCDFCGRVPVVGRFRHLASGIEKGTCSSHATRLRNRSDWIDIQK